MLELHHIPLISRVKCPKKSSLPFLELEERLSYTFFHAYSPPCITTLGIQFIPPLSQPSIERCKRPTHAGHPTHQPCMKIKASIRRWECSDIPPTSPAGERNTMSWGEIYSFVKIKAQNRGRRTFGEWGRAGEMLGSSVPLVEIGEYRV